MKTLYLIGGTMGVGKTAVSHQLKMQLANSVFLDGDWCWDAHPFQVTEETKEMVLNNICTILNNFLQCSVYENIIFCWVMHEQSIIDTILARLNPADCRVIPISLICSKEKLVQRLEQDVAAGVRTDDVIQRSVERIGLYQNLNTIKIDTSDKSVAAIVKEIAAL